MSLLSLLTRKDGGSQRRHVRGSLVLLLVALALLVAVPTVTSVKMDLEHYGSTVAGALSTLGSTNGITGVSRFTNPQGICGSANVSDTDNEEFLVGDSNALRIYTRDTTYLSTWFNNAASNSASNADGPIFSSGTTTLGTVNSVLSCRKYTDNYNISGVVNFFVTSSNTIRYVYNNYLYTYTYTADTTIQFRAVTTYAPASGTGTLYALSTGNAVVACPISWTYPVISSCTQLTLSPSITTTSTIKGIVATSDRIIFTTGSALVMYSISGSTATQVASVTGAFVDVKMAPDNSMYAITSSAVYTVAATSTTLTATLYAGTETSPCNPVSGNIDGVSPTFCGMQSLFPYSASEMYMSITQSYVLRSLTLPKVQVPIFFGRIPFPIDFVNKSLILPTLLSDMQTAVRSNVNTDNATLQADFPPTVNASSGLVNDDTWDTDYTILVPQQAFDTTTTVAEVWAANYAQTLVDLETYYNKTNEVFYGDNNVQPVCNRTKEFLVEKSIAKYARTQLNYSLIYTNKTFQTDAVNVSGVKLLMPMDFGDVSPYSSNTTTHGLLFPSDTIVKNMLLQAVRDSYPASSKHNLSFSQQTYRFDLLDSDQTTSARWWIQNRVMQRVRECAAAAGNPAGNGTTMVVGYHNSTQNATNVTGIGGGNGPELICVPIVGITNQSVTAGVGSTYNNYNYELFLPEGYNFTGTEFDSCMNTTDWSDLEKWINGQPKKKKKGCNTGCIIGVAVASAAVACVLIAVIVVLTSKRRRLATVVAPPANGGAAKPRFTSTVDLDEENSTSNPLVA